MSEWSHAALCIFLAGAAWTDVRNGKVRNGWLFLGAGAGIVCRGWIFFLPAGTMMVLGFCLFRFRLMGAGDGKCMALIAGYLGFWEGLTAIWFGLLTGAVWSVCRLWQNRSFRMRLNYLIAYFMRTIQQQCVTAYDDFSVPDQGQRIPLAACLAAGVAWYLAWNRMTGRGV